MAQNIDDIKWLYGKLKSQGYDIGSEQEFTSSLANEEDRDWYYSKAVGMGLDMGSKEDFNSLYAPAASGAAGGSPTDKPADASGVKTPADKPADAGGASGGATEQPWRPTEQEKIRMAAQMGDVVSDFNAKSGAIVARGRQSAERYTPEGRARLKGGEFQARVAGTRTRVIGLTPNVSVASEEEKSQGKSGEEARPLLDGKSPVPYGVKQVDGKAVTEWLLPDGTLTTDLVEADKAEYGARRVRLMNQFTERMRQNGLDPANAADVEKQAQMDFEAPIRKAVGAVLETDDERSQEEREAYMSNPLNMVGGVNAALGHAAARREAGIGDLTRMAEEAYESLPADYRKELVDSYTAYFSENPDATGGKSVAQAAQDAAKSVVYSHVHEEYVKRMGPQSKNEFFLRKILELNPASVTLSSTVNPRGQAYAELDAMDRYGAEHKGLALTGTIAGMAIDPTVYFGGLVGKGAFNLATRAIGKAMTRNVAGSVAGRLATTTLAGRLGGGMAAGMANLGTFEFVKDAERQLYQGGYVNPETGDMEGYSFQSMFSSGVHGLKMGAATGVVAPLLGNVANKLVKATSSTGGKVALRAGETALSKLFEGTIFASSDIYDIRNMPDEKFDRLYAKQYGYDTETDETKKAEARRQARNDMSVDAWNDSMAMMMGFGVSHFVKSAPSVIRSLCPVKPTGDRPLSREDRIHNNRNFRERVNRWLDGPEEMALTREEREELLRTGYGRLADLFVRDGKRVKEVMPDGTERDSGVAERGTYFADGVLVRYGETAGGRDFEAVEGEFDGYEMMEHLMKDGRVSEATRAKAYYILTGRGLPMSTVMGWTRDDHADGAVTISSVNSDGGRVTVRRFTDEKSAQREISRIERQVELNTIDVGEQYRMAAAWDDMLSAAIRSVLNVSDVEAVKSGSSDVTDGQRDLAAMIDEAMEHVKSEMLPEGIRARISKETGVDVDKAIRKEREERSEAEQKAVERYVRELFPEDMEMRNDPMDIGGPAPAETSPTDKPADADAASPNEAPAADKPADADPAATAGEEEAGGGGTGEAVAERAVADTAAYDRGYDDCVTYVKDYSDERIASEIEKLRGHDTLTDYGRGWLEAMEYEQQERAQRGTGTAESAANSTGNAVSDAGNPAEGAGSVENVQETALSRIPFNEEKQDYEYTSVDPETGWDGLVEVMEGEANALPIARQMIEDATKQLETLKKKPPTPVKPKLAGKGGPMAMRAEQKRVDEANAKAQAEYQEALSAAQAEAEGWSRILGVYTSRDAELRRVQEEERRQRDAAAHDEAQARFEEEQRIRAEKEAEAERLGTHNVHPRIKEKWDAAPKVEGHQDIITLPDGSTLTGRYILTEAGAASASHDAKNGFIPTEGFPVDKNGQCVNDRDYERDREAQRIVNDMAGAYDNRALQTPVIVSGDGIVLSGNNRTMSGDMAAEQGTDAAYLEYLGKYGRKFGFTPEQVAGMAHPRVVFVPDEALPYDAATFARFNAQEMKSQSKPEAAVKLGKIVPDETFNRIVADLNRYDRLSDFYADQEATAQTLRELEAAGVINDKQLPELMTGHALSAAGKELIENTLIGKVFQSDPDAVRRIISIPTLRQSVVMGLGEIAANRALARGGYDVAAELAAAVDLVNRARASAPDKYREGMPVSPFGRQMGLFDDEYGDSRVTDGATLLLADMLNSGRPGDLRKVLAMYNKEASLAASGQMDLFSGEVASKENILRLVNEQFRNATPKEQRRMVEGAIAARKDGAEQNADRGGQTAQQASDAGERGEGGAQRAGGDARMDGEGSGGVQEKEVTAPLSESEKDEYGKPLVKASDGTTVFGKIDSESGLTAAPIRLSLGENRKDPDGSNHGYGLLHIEAGHGEQIRNAGFASVEEFVENVAHNYTSIKEGAMIHDKQTYLLEVSDKHNNTLFVQLSRDGSYWNVNSAGIFKKRYSRNKREVYALPAVGGHTDTDTPEVDSGHNEGATAPAGNSPQTSKGKVNALSAEKQAAGSESVDQNSSSLPGLMVQARLPLPKSSSTTSGRKAQHISIQTKLPRIYSEIGMIRMLL